MHRLIALIALVVSTMTAAAAHATSCGNSVGFDLLPEDGAAVPRNSRVWHATRGDATGYVYRWHDSDGVAVALSVQRIPIADGLTLVVLSAEQLLRFPASYEVEVCWKPDVSSGKCPPPTRFSTLDEIDEEPPAQPQAEEWKRISEESELGTSRMVLF